MNDQRKKIAVRRPQDSGLVYTTNGRNHRIATKGDAANGLAVAASAIGAFIVGFLLLLDKRITRAEPSVSNSTVTPGTSPV